jgi:hypothetical protein
VADIKQKAGTVQTLEASGAAVSNGDWGTANDADLDNTATLAFSYDFVLTCAFGSSVSADKDITLILVPKINGTDAADIDTANDKFQEDHYAGSFRTKTTGTSSRRMTIQGVPVGPYKYTAYLFNESGVQISATWVLAAYPVLAQN